MEKPLMILGREGQCVAQVVVSIEALVSATAVWANTGGQPRHITRNILAGCARRTEPRDVLATRAYDTASDAAGDAGDAELAREPHSEFAGNRPEATRGSGDDLRV
eukprot:SAG11_NODE_2033_length_3899_cov_2.298421_2_plen_106_part_00